MLQIMATSFETISQIRHETVSTAHGDMAQHDAAPMGVLGTKGDIMHPCLSHAPVHHVAPSGPETVSSMHKRGRMPRNVEVWRYGVIDWNKQGWMNLLDFNLLMRILDIDRTRQGYASAHPQTGGSFYFRGYDV